MKRTTALFITIIICQLESEYSIKPVTQLLYLSSSEKKSGNEKMCGIEKSPGTKTKLSHGLQTWTQKISFWETML